MEHGNHSCSHGLKNIQTGLKILVYFFFLSSQFSRDLKGLCHEMDLASVDMHGYRSRQTL
jgi:hypothetical protein